MTQIRYNITVIHPLQTQQWADFRHEWGNEIVKTEFGYLTFIKLPYTNKKVGTFLKCPDPTTKMLTFLQNYAKENNIIFIKLEPNTVIKKDSKTVNDKEKYEKLFKKHNTKPGKTLFTPTTFWIDLAKSEEDLLAHFHHKTRYNIRLAKKKGVEIVEDNSDEAFEKYLELTRETVIRDKFFAHNEKYHRLMWKHLKKDIARLLVAKHEGRTLATWILFTNDSFLYYPYGASTHKYKNVMASNLMMWEAIRFGKRLGLTTFDLWGREPGSGFTKFKEGYNPQVVEFLGSWDLVVDKFAYEVYKKAEAMRWLMLKTRVNLGFTKYRF